MLQAASLTPFAKPANSRRLAEPQIANRKEQLECIAAPRVACIDEIAPPGGTEFDAVVGIGHAQPGADRLEPVGLEHRIFVRVGEVEHAGAEDRPFAPDRHTRGGAHFLDDAGQLLAAGVGVVLDLLEGALRVACDALREVAAGDVIGDEFGRFVSLSDDGKTLAVAAERNDGFDQEGRVRIYQFEGDSTSWKQLGQDIDGESATDGSGFSVSLSADGTTVAIGAPYSHNYGDYSGHVRVYRMDESESDWKQLGDDIEGETAYDWLGFSVSLSADGNTVAIGSPNNAVNGDSSGHVRVFVLE